MARTNAEIDHCWADYAGSISQATCSQTGAIYARYSTRHQDSVADQVRKILDDAVKQRIFIRREMIFFDVAIIGGKLSRPGLDKLCLVLSRRQVQAVLFFGTNRLFRRAFESYNFVNQIHRTHGIRCRFVSEGIDTCDARRWESALTTNAFIDQMTSRQYVENIRSSQEGLLIEGFVYGNLPYGFQGTPVEGMLSRKNKPKLRISIDEAEARVVILVFNLYAEDRRSIAFIVAHLNTIAATIPAPATESGQWTSLVIRTMLSNERYLGKWSYGVTQSVFLPEADYRRAIPREQPIKTVQFDQLRIVDEKLWHETQAERAKRGRGKGRKGHPENIKKHPKILNGLLICKVHQCPLWTHGQDCSTYACRKCLEMAPSERPLFTHLNRVLATRIVFRQLLRLLRQDKNLIERVISRCQELAGAAQRPDVSEVTAVKKEIQRLDVRIQFVLANSGETDSDREQSGRVLREMRAEKQSKQARVEHLESSLQQPVIVPTEDQVRRALGKLENNLAEPSVGEDAANFGSIRRLLEKLTGGRIELTQMGERQHLKGWLQGTAATDLLAVVAEDSTGQRIVNQVDAAIMFDFRRHQGLPPHLDEVKVLFDQGLLLEEIATRTNLNRNRVRRLLEIWYQNQSVPIPNLRRRAKAIKAARRKPA